MPYKRIEEEIGLVSRPVVIFALKEKSGYEEWFDTRVGVACAYTRYGWDDPLYIEFDSDFVSIVKFKEKSSFFELKGFEDKFFCARAMAQHPTTFGQDRTSLREDPTSFIYQIIG